VAAGTTEWIERIKAELVLRDFIERLGHICRSQ